MYNYTLNPHFVNHGTSSPRPFTPHTPQYHRFPPTPTSTVATPVAPNAQPRMERSMREVHGLKQARREAIERRCATLDQPIPPALLDHLESFRAACQITRPLTDEDWEILKPRLILERPLAEVREKEDQLVKAKQAQVFRDVDVKSEPSGAQDSIRDRDSREARQREQEEQQKPLRKRLARYVEEFVKYHWVNGQDITKDTCPDFAAQALIHVRGRFYAELDQERLDHSISGLDPAIKSEFEPFPFRHLTLEHMKWVFDTKVKPFTEGFQRELFICNGCDNNAKFFGFEGVIQHFAHKHTNALSKGSMVVYWQAEWPERSPFSRNPSTVRAKMLASSPPASAYAASTAQESDRAARPAYPPAPAPNGPYTRPTPSAKPAQPYQQVSPSEYPRPTYGYPDAPPTNSGPQFDPHAAQQHPGAYENYSHGPVPGGWQSGKPENRDHGFPPGPYGATPTAVASGNPPGPPAPGYQGGPPALSSPNAQPLYVPIQQDWPPQAKGPSAAAAGSFQISGDYPPEAAAIRRERGYYAAQPPDPSMRPSRQYERQEGPRPVARRRSQSPFRREEGVPEREIYRDRSPTVRPAEQAIPVRYADAYGDFPDVSNVPRRAHAQYINERDYEALEAPVKYVIIRESGQHYAEAPIRDIRDRGWYDTEYRDQGIYEHDGAFVRVDSRVPVQGDLVESVPRAGEQRPAMYRERQHMPVDSRPANPADDPVPGTRSTDPRYR